MCYFSHSSIIVFWFRDVSLSDSTSQSSCHLIQTRQKDPRWASKRKTAQHSVPIVGHKSAQLNLFWRLLHRVSSLENPLVCFNVFLDLEYIKENPYKNTRSTGFYTNSQYMLATWNFKLLQDRRWQIEHLAQFAQGDNQVHVKHKCTTSLVNLV